MSITRLERRGGGIAGSVNQRVLLAEVELAREGVLERESESCLLVLSDE